MLGRNEEEEFEHPPEVQMILEKYLSKLQPFDKEDSSQVFYRENQSLGTESPPLVRHGWRIAEIAPEQQSLALYCFALLESQLQLPLSFSFLRQAVRPSYNEQFQQKRYSTFLWMEASFMSVTENAVRENIEYSYIMLCRSKLIPLFATFVANHTTWPRMMAQDYHELQVVARFQKVAMVARDILSSFRIGIDYSMVREVSKRKPKPRMLEIEQTGS